MLEMALYSAVAPVILLLLSSVVSYPAALEEVVKWGILRFRTDDLRFRVYDGAVVGLVFGLSEAVLYLSTAWGSGQWDSLVWRLILTVPMHSLTGAIIGMGRGKRAGWLLVGIAMAIHAGFNYWVGLRS